MDHPAGPFAPVDLGYRVFGNYSGDTMAKKARTGIASNSRGAVRLGKNLSRDASARRA